MANVFEKVAGVGLFLWGHTVRLIRMAKYIFYNFVGIKNEEIPQIQLTESTIFSITVCNSSSIPSQSGSLTSLSLRSSVLHKSPRVSPTSRPMGELCNGT